MCAGAGRAGDEVGAESSLSLIARYGLVPLPLAPLPLFALDRGVVSLVLPPSALGVVFLVVLVPPPSALDVVALVVLVPPPSALDVVALVLPPSVLDAVFLVLPPSALDFVFLVPPTALVVFRVAPPHALCARLLGPFPRAINLLLVVRVQERLPRVLLQVVLFSLPRSDWLEKVCGLSAGDADAVGTSKEASFVLLQEFGLERVHLVLDAFLPVHGDDDASVLVRGGLGLALWVATVGVQNLVVAAAVAVLADDGVVFQALGLIVHRGVDVQAQILAFEA